MSTQISDVERAELMLSLGMNDNGEPLSDEERATLEQYVADNTDAPPVPDGAEAVEPHNLHMATPANEQPQQGSDIQALIQQEIAKQLGGAGAAAAGPVTVEQFLSTVDARDSDTFLTLLQALIDTGRLQNIGTINGGGYMFHYSEPKGASREGYTPGKTKGGRMVDQALDTAKAAGAKPKQVGMCDKCFGAVEKHDDGSITNTLGDPVCPNANGGVHNFTG